MKLPDDIQPLLVRRFQRKHREWLIDETSESQWPLEIALGIPTEQATLRQVDGVRAWVRAWLHWQGVGALSWCERRWQALGVQRLPEKLTLYGPEEVAQWIGEAARWQQARARYQTLTICWPALARQLPRFFDVLADYGDADFRCLAKMLAWISGNPKSRLYPRQIPVAGTDSKWLESRKGLIAETWLRHSRMTRQESATSSGAAVCGHNLN